MSKFYKFRKEELPIVADFIKQVFNRDQAEFEKFSPDFNARFVADFESKIESVTHLVHPQTLNAEIKEASERLHEHLYAIRPILEHIQAYAMRASKELTINHREFGCREARLHARKKQVDDLMTWIKVVEQNIANNKAALEAKGYKESMWKELTQLINKVEEEHQLYTQKLTERKQLVSDNMKEFDELWKMLHDISATGRLIFKYKNTKKMQEYMFSHMIKKVRNAAKPKVEKKKRKLVPPQAVTAGPQAEPVQVQEQPELQLQD